MAEAVVEERQLLKALRWYDGFVVALANPGFLIGSLGYSIEDGPEVDTDHNNFGALNIPDDHPARDLQDTFFVEGGHVLRTHTSNVQIRAMTGRTPPFRFIAPGRV